MDDLDDLEGAVDGALRGDEAAFQRIVEATSDRLVRLSARMLGNLPDAEDVVQEAYVKAYIALTGGKFDRRSNVRTWLYRIATNATLDAMRSRARRPPPTDRADDAMADSHRIGAVPMEARIALSELSSFLADLPDEQKVTLVLKAVEGMSSGEIAEIMQCTEGAVEQRLVRARAALRKRIAS